MSAEHVQTACQGNTVLPPRKSARSGSSTSPLPSSKRRGWEFWSGILRIRHCTSSWGGGGSGILLPQAGTLRLQAASDQVLQLACCCLQAIHPGRAPCPALPTTSELAQGRLWEQGGRTAAPTAEEPRRGPGAGCRSRRGDAGAGGALRCTRAWTPARPPAWRGPGIARPPPATAPQAAGARPG